MLVLYPLCHACSFRCCIVLRVVHCLKMPCSFARFDSVAYGFPSYRLILLSPFAALCDGWGFNFDRLGLFTVSTWILKGGIWIGPMGDEIRISKGEKGKTDQLVGDWVGVQSVWNLMGLGLYGRILYFCAVLCWYPFVPYLNKSFAAQLGRANIPACPEHSLVEGNNS